MTDDVLRVPIGDLDAAHREQMLVLVEHYYREPELGLAEELADGNAVYFMETADGAIGSFLIVNFDHHGATIDGRPHRFTYLGLGCATEKPFPPLPRRVKDDFARILAPGCVGVLHLSTKTPFAYHGIELAYGSDVYPSVDGAVPSDVRKIAAHIKESIHHHGARADGEDPFLLRAIKKVRFTDAELERIRGYRGETPLSRYDLSDHDDDEVIVLHRFTAS